MNKDLLKILSESNKDIDNQQLMDYLSGKLSGEALHEMERSMADNAFLNDAVEGLQQVKDKKDMEACIDALNAAMLKTLDKKKNRRLRRRLKDEPLTYLAILLVLALCVIGFFIIRKLLQ